MIKQPLSEALMVKVNAILDQYEHGAIVTSDVLLSIMNLVDEQWVGIAAESNEAHQVKNTAVIEDNGSK